MEAFCSKKLYTYGDELKIELMVLPFSNVFFGDLPFIWHRGEKMGNFTLCNIFAWKVPSAGRLSLMNKSTCLPAGEGLSVINLFPFYT